MNNPISQPYFQCERLDVYHVAVKFHRSIIPLKNVRGAADLRDQLHRASESIVLNIAEGAGRYSIDDKRRFYRFASGSAMKAAIPRGGFGESTIQKENESNVPERWSYSTIAASSVMQAIKPAAIS